jgi:hypothetical protein
MNKLKNKIHYKKLLTPLKYIVYKDFEGTLIIEVLIFFYLRNLNNICDIVFLPKFTI